MIYRTLCSICNSLISIITWSNDEGDAAAACDEESTTMSRQHFFPVTMTLVGGGFKGDFQELFENNNIKLGLFCLGDGFGHHWVVVNNLWQVCERGIYKHVHRGKIPWKWRNAHHVFFFVFKVGFGLLLIDTSSMRVWWSNLLITSSSKVGKTYTSHAISTSF